MISIAASLSLANTVSIETGDLRKGTAFDSVKATWNQALKLGEHSTRLTAEYDSGANRDFLKEATLTGSLLEPREAAAAKGRSGAVDASDLSVTYEVTHDFASKNTDVKLSANTKIEGTKVGCEFDDSNGLTEVSAERELGVGDQSLNVQPSWLVQAKTARVKLMSKLGGCDTLTAQVDYTPDSKAAEYEVTVDHNIDAGRDVSATLGGGAKTVDVEYVDTKTEDGATWTASASVPYDGKADLLDSVKLTLKRAWKW